MTIMIRFAVVMEAAIGVVLVVAGLTTYTTKAESSSRRLLSSS